MSCKTLTTLTIITSLLIVMSVLNAETEMGHNINYVNEPLHDVIRANLIGLDLGEKRVTEIRFQDDDIKETKVNFKGFVHPGLKEGLVRIILSNYGLAHYIDRKTGKAFVFSKPDFQSIRIYYNDSYLVNGTADLPSRELEPVVSEVHILDKNAFDLLPNRFLKEIQFSNIPDFGKSPVAPAMADADFLFLFETEGKSFAYAISRSTKGWITAEGKWEHLPETKVIERDFFKLLPEYLAEFLRRDCYEPN